MAKYETMTIEISTISATADAFTQIARPLNDGWELDGAMPCGSLAPTIMYRLRRPIPEPSIESVYGMPLEKLTAPEGWEFTGEFRLSEPGDKYLSRVQYDGQRVFTGTTTVPVLILRRKPKPRRWIVEERPEGIEPPGWMKNECIRIVEELTEPAPPTDAELLKAGRPREWRVRECGPSSQRHGIIFEPDEAKEDISVSIVKEAR